MNSRWKKSYWFTQPQFNFATPAAAITGADGAGSGAPATGGGAGAGGGTPASTGSTPAAPDPWAAPTVPAQLREGYNKLKSEHEALQKQFEPWKGLNVQPSEVQHFQQSYQQVYSEMKGIGDTLGINEKEIADAVRVHGLVPVLDQLRYEAQQAEAVSGGDQSAIQQQELEDRIAAGIETRLSPVLERENQRLVTEANTLVGNTITQLATAAFKTAGYDYAQADPELRNFIETGVTEALKYDDEGMRDLKFGGKTAAVQKAFQTFTAMFDAAYLSRRKMEGNVAVRGPQGPQQRPAQGGAKPPSLEQMIDQPDTIRTSQGRPAYST